VSSAIEVDQWDTEIERAVKVPPFASARRGLVKRFGPWGGDAADDIFWLLFKARPSLTDVAEVEAAHVVGHVLVSMLSRHPEVRRLRISTMRDVTGSALAAARLAPQFARAAAEATPAPSLTPEGETGRQELVDRAEEAAEAALDGLESAVGALAGDAEYEAAAADAWGLEAGGLQRLSVPERMALARQLDTDRVRKITDLFGRLRTAMFADRAELEDTGVEPVDVELGGDLGRIVGAELLSMLCEDLFFARLADESLMQYAMRGESHAGRGGIVLCVDGSGSMGTPHQGYTRELWASALKLHLLRTAVRENRPMHVIDFGAANEHRYQRFVDPDERTPLKMLGTAQTWFGWGTDFGAPLRLAIQVLADENDRSSDIVFVSDGECALAERTRKTYERACRGRGIRTWGVQLGKRPGGLRSFCDRIFTVTDLTSGRELGALLNAVER
jgi:uncharacterized protein with von Willebrand factor type A (vWA) domain